MLNMVISGGQTGADKIGLEEARKAGIPTGGTAAKGWMTEDGPDPSLADFGLVECSKPGYPARTLQNVLDSDATVLFGDMASTGSLQTIRYCVRHGKIYLTNPQYWELVEWIKKHDIYILNVAGNRGSKLDTLKQLAIRNALHEAFIRLA